MSAWLRDTQAGTNHARGLPAHPDDAVIATVLDVLAATKPHKDGSRRPALTPAQVDGLAEYVSYLVSTAGEDASARADLNAAAATVRGCRAARHQQDLSVRHLSPKKVAALRDVDAGRVEYGVTGPAMARRAAERGREKAGVPDWLIDGVQVYGQAHRLYAELEVAGLIVVRHDEVATVTVPAETFERRTISGAVRVVELPERQVPADPGWRAHVTLCEAGAAVLAATEGDPSLSDRPLTDDQARVLDALPREARRGAPTSRGTAQQQPAIVTELARVIRRHVVCTQETQTALAHAVLDVVAAGPGALEVGTVRRDERGQL